MPEALTISSNLFGFFFRLKNHNRKATINRPLPIKCLSNFLFFQLILEAIVTLLLNHTVEYSILTLQR